MTPDVWTILDVVNATNQDMLVGTKRDGQEGFVNEYQMNEWFSGLSFDSVIAYARGISDPNETRIQFLRGVGDEDDGADMVWVFSDDKETNSIWYQARSADNSGHYVGFEILNLPGLFVVASNPISGNWLEVDPTTIEWYNDYDSNKFLPPGGVYLGDKKGYFLVADLAAIFSDNALANEIFDHIKKHTASDEDKKAIYEAVKTFVYENDETKTA